MQLFDSWLLFIRQDDILYRICKTETETNILYFMKFSVQSRNIELLQLSVTDGLSEWQSKGQTGS